jgi:hypothetical protein
MRMTIAQAVHELEVAAETGKLQPEVVEVVRRGLTMRVSARERQQMHDRIVRQLGKIALGPRDVLVLRLPPEVLADEQQMRQVTAAVRDIAEVAKQGVVIMQEGTPLTAEMLPQPERKPVIHLPGEVPLPPGLRR